MKPSVIKILPAIILITVSVLVFNSCKKTDTSANQTETEIAKARAIEAARQRYGNITASVIFTANRAAPVSYIDANGVSHDMGGYLRTQVRCGQYTCATATSGSDLYVTSTLQYVKWYYECGVGHNLAAIWKISVPYTLLLQHPSTSAYSFGNIRIKNPGGTVLATSGDLGQNNLEIVNNGADPACLDNTLYTVTYTWQNISDTYFPGNKVECQYTVYNDCDKTNYNNVVGWTLGQTYTNATDVFSAPCDRTEHAYVNPPGGGNNYSVILGAYSLCLPPSGFTGTSDHQVEYRLVNNGSSNLWDDQSSTVYWGFPTLTATQDVPTMSSYTGVLFLLNMTSSSGTWLVRYRNRHSGCDPTINGKNDNWNDGNGNNNYVTEIWAL